MDKRKMSLAVKVLHLNANLILFFSSLQPELGFCPMQQLHGDISWTSSCQSSPPAQHTFGFGKSEQLKPKPDWVTEIKGFSSQEP